MAPPVGSADFLNFNGLFTVGSSQHTDVLTCNGNVLVGLIQPSSQLVSTSITFEVAQGSTYTFYTLATSSGGSYTINTSTQSAMYYTVDYTRFLGAAFIKAVMQSSQDGTKTMIPVTRPFT